jgi:hypothetical protein
VRILDIILTVICVVTIRYDMILVFDKMLVIDI